MDVELHVVLATDRRFVVPCAVTGRSIIENCRAPDQLQLHIIASGVDESLRGQLLRSWEPQVSAAQVNFHDFPLDRVAHLLRSKNVSHMSYARLLLDEFLPPRTERAVYVDTDVIFGRDVRELGGLDLNGAVIGAVPNADADDAARQFARLGVIGRDYFNAGIFVVDLPLWRNLQVGRRALNVAAEMGELLHMHDQDALNVVLAEFWTPVPETWNSQARRVQSPDGRVLHYTMVPKPWDADYDGPHGHLYYDVLSRTQFASTAATHFRWLRRVAARLKRMIPYGPTVVRHLRALLRA